MRLTLDVIGSAEQRFGPLREHIVSFRGLKIPAIENLGATNDYFDTMDLCDNDLIKLENFPPLKRLTTLLVANNCIRKLDIDLFSNLSSLVSLILTNNKLATIQDLVPLARAKNLERLSLVDNPVTSVEHYRYYLIYSIPTLRFLDFQHIKDHERHTAKQFFTSSEGVNLLRQINAAQVRKDQTSTSSLPLNYTVKSQGGSLKEQDTPKKMNDSYKSTLKQEEIIALEDAIASATDLAHVQAYEQALETGVIPADMRVRLNLPIS